ncbi:MAG: diguanylate cyclase response regulator [Chloroflexota bacterium]|nr:diguanylate cyclase response regulator [Chloroflexota bacterium]
MKILVLTNDLMERTVIQQVLQRNRHEIVMAENSEVATELLKQGEIRFIIADRATTDIDEKQFIKRVRDARPPYYIYILLIATKIQDTDVTSQRTGADDYLHKPIVPVELKSRVHIGERILGLGDNLVHAQGDVENTAMYDPITNALNRKAFLAISRGEIERARRSQSSLSLIAMDIDNFKTINEQHGRDIGNDVLNVVSQSIREKSRPYDSVARYEDDLFLLILPSVIGQEAEKIAQRILKGVHNINISLLDGTAVHVNLSAGIASAMHITAATELDMLVQKASEAMQQAKREGGNQVYTVFV